MQRKTGLEKFGNNIEIDKPRAIIKYSLKSIENGIIFFGNIIAN